MTSDPTLTLLAAVAREFADMGRQVDDLAVLTSDLMAYCPADRRGEVMKRAQAYDLLSQRLAALGDLSASLGAGASLEAALADVTLSDLAQRLGRAAHDVKSNPAASGDLELFD